MKPYSAVYPSDELDVKYIKSTLKGDTKSLNLLIMNHQAYIYNVAWKMTGNIEEAKDLSQEVLIKIISNLGKFKFKSSFRTWAYRITFNHFINERKKMNLFIPTSFEETGKNQKAAPVNYMTDIEEEEEMELLQKVRLNFISGLLLCLKKEQRLIFIIGEIFRGDHTVGSEIMDISKANFRMKLSKSRKDLSHFMSGKCGLVDERNPCRCHKKVKTVIDMKSIEAKKLLHNKVEYETFKSYLVDDADFIATNIDLKYAELQNNTYKEDFDKKSFIENILNDKNWKSILNLN